MVVNFPLEFEFFFNDDDVLEVQPINIIRFITVGNRRLIGNVGDKSKKITFQ
jgi:hypothetical protein